uniref:Uncharacterized protein n=1 Tax=Panagrolaimus sp. PS1159 TaxID=55785 RepID=A0AC35FXV9_9BILA
IPEVSLSHRGSRRESRRESHQDIKQEYEDSAIVGEEKSEHAKHENVEHSKDEQHTTEVTDPTADTAATDQQYYDHNAYGYDPHYANYGQSQSGQAVTILQW